MNLLTQPFAIGQNELLIVSQMTIKIAALLDNIIFMIFEKSLDITNNAEKSAHTTLPI